MTQLNLKPNHAPIKAYCETLAKFGRAHFDNEGDIREAFSDHLKRCARQFDWTLVPEYPISRTCKNWRQRTGLCIQRRVWFIRSVT
jgi:hypothetical protein